MTSNSEEDFSLKEWVMKRAANQMGGQVSNGFPGNDHLGREDRILGSKAPSDRLQEKLKDATVETASIYAQVTEKTKIAHFTPVNGAAAMANGHAALNGGGSATQAVQNLQIVKLLQDLGERLRSSEKEREVLWRELDGCRKLLSDIEDKTSKTEKAYLTLENRVTQAAADNATDDLAERQAEIEKLSQILQSKIDAIETATGSAVLRIEDAVSENSKLSRRLDQVAQDKVRLQRKLETMEEALTQTQDTLKAKALVLLTDNALAARTTLPQNPVWAGNDTLRMTPPQADMPRKSQAEPAGSPNTMIDDEALFRKRPRTQTSMLVSLVLLGMAGGWALSRMPMLATGFFAPKAAAPAAAVAVSETSAPDQDAVMAQIAQLANQVEPGQSSGSATVSSQPAAQDPTVQQLGASERSAVANFNADAPVGDVSERIKPDAALPKVVKDIETRAFDGDAEAQHDLAAIYTAGHAGVKTDYVKAAAWFTEASHNNVANAQYNLAVLYHQGLGVRQDTAKAIQLYRVAASNGHPEAQYNLGIAHIEGVGADYSPRLAAAYFEQAATGGIVEAAYNLGLIEENGLLGEAKPDEAIFWYKTAADQGNAQAKQALAQLQKQMKMTDQETARIFNRIAILKPNAFNPKDPNAVSGAAMPQTGKASSTNDGPAMPQPETGDATSTGRNADDAADNNAATPAAVASETAAPESVIVAQIQEQLSRLGLYAGEADGETNAATEEAVRSYQAMNDLKVDGKATEDILVHMLASELQGSEPAAAASE